MIGGNKYRYCREYNIALSNIGRMGTEVGRQLDVVPTITSHTSTNSNNKNHEKNNTTIQYDSNNDCMPATTRATRTRPATTIIIIQLGMTLVRKRAVEKTSQALREGPPKFRQQMVELGGVAGVTAGGGTTTSSTATASGVAAGTGTTTTTTTTTAATGASFQMCFYLYFGVQQSPLLPPTPGSSY